MDNMNRINNIVEELIALEDALQIAYYRRAYSIYRKFIDDIFGIAVKDYTAAIDLFNELTKGYEIDDYYQVFVLAF